MEARDGLALFTFSWPNQRDPFAVEVFATSPDEAEDLVRETVESNGKRLEGRYGPSYVYVTKVEKGLRESEEIHTKKFAPSGESR